MLDNAKVDALATELAAITGESTTDAVITALEQRLSRERSTVGGKSRAERMRAFLDQIADERNPDAPGSDLSWMYDENGLPK
jgi:hypothetical protein